MKTVRASRAKTRFPSEKRKSFPASPVRGTRDGGAMSAHSVRGAHDGSAGSAHSVRSMQDGSAGMADAVWGTHDGSAGSPDSVRKAQDDSARPALSVGSAHDFGASTPNGESWGKFSVLTGPQRVSWAATASGVRTDLQSRTKTAGWTTRKPESGTPAGSPAMAHSGNLARAGGGNHAQL